MDDKQIKEYIGLMANLAIVPQLIFTVPVSYHGMVEVRFTQRPTKSEIQALISHLAMIAKTAPDISPGSLAENCIDAWEKFYTSKKETQ